MAATAITAVSLFAASTAQAGGDVYKAERPAIWKGFYFGGHIGLAKAESELEFLGVDVVEMDDEGFAGGVHIGYNWQRGDVVYGIEADYTFTGIDYDLTFPGGSIELASIDGLGSVRGRVGYAINNLLLFATAGVAWKNTDTIVPVDLDDTGYVLGAGAELKVGQKYSIKAEALHYSFDNESIFGAGVVDVDTDVTVVRTGLTFHLN